MITHFISRTVRVAVLVLFVLASLLLAKGEVSAIGSLGWARNIGGTDSEGSNGNAVDAAGNVYTTGWFQGTADFDPGAGVFNLTSAGGADIFVSKLDNNGNFLWARSMGGIGNDVAVGIAVESTGKMYLTGTFESTVDFDPGPGTASLTSAGGEDIFVVKLDDDGNLVWAGGMGDVSNDRSRGLALDSNGNVHTTGTFEGTVDFDPGPGTASLTSAGNSDMFLSKLDANGSYVWAFSMGGPQADVSEYIAVDPNGNVYTSGYFNGTVDFDPGPGTADLTGAPYSFFLSKLDSNGGFVWVRDMGGILSESGAEMTVDSGGNVYLVGTFFGTSDFDPGPGVFNLTGAGIVDIYVSKLDSSGNFLWARGMGGAGLDWGLSLALDPAGNAYTTGMFAGPVDFDPGPGTAILTGSGNTDIFLSKLDSNGGYVWAQSLGGTGYDQGADIVLDSSLNIYMTGYFQGPADFDPGPGTTSLTSAGDTDMFIAKLQNVAVFADVPSGYWAQNFIERLYMAGITGGCATGPLRYCPEDTVTRAQMAVFLLKGRHGSSYTPPAVGTTTGFGDVPVDYWAAAFIKQLAAEGITAGCGSGNYCPEQPVTRAQMAVFLLRSKYGASYTPPAVGSSTGFGDVPPDYWAAAFIKQLVAEGITVGCGSGNYCPEAPVTRAQMAVFLVRTFSLP